MKVYSTLKYKTREEIPTALKVLESDGKLWLYKRYKQTTISGFTAQAVCNGPRTGDDDANVESFELSPTSCLNLIVDSEGGNYSVQSVTDIFNLLLAK